MEFALRQLVLDPEWTGTGADGIALGAAGTFAIEFAGEGPTGGSLMRMTGADGESTAMLQAEVVVGGCGPGSLLESCGLVTLGGDFDANNVEVDAGADDWVDPGIDDPTISSTTSMWTDPSTPSTGWTART